MWVSYLVMSEIVFIYSPACQSNIILSALSNDNCEDGIFPVADYVVTVLIFWLARVAGIHEYLLPFPYLHMITLTFTYDIMDV